jgi:hypothetical protein
MPQERDQDDGDLRAPVLARRRPPGRRAATPAWPASSSTTHPGRQPRRSARLSRAAGAPVGARDAGERQAAILSATPASSASGRPAPSASSSGSGPRRRTRGCYGCLMTTAADRIRPRPALRSARSTGPAPRPPRSGTATDGAVQPANGRPPRFCPSARRLASGIRWRDDSLALCGQKKTGPSFAHPCAKAARRSTRPATNMS